MGILSELHPLLRKAVAFAVLAAVLVIGLMLAGGVRRPDSVTFVLTGDTQGLLVPCGCSVTPSGGLARRAAFIAQVRAERPGTAVVPVEVAHPFADRGPAKELINRTVAEFMLRQRYGLVGLGPLDLPEFRRKAPLYGDLPLALAGEPDLPGSVEYHLGGWGFGGWSAGGARLRLAVLAEDEGGSLGLPDPVAALMEEQRRNPAEGWIVLGRISPECATRILRGFPGVLAIVAHWKGVITSKPRDAEKRWVVFLGDRGRRACTLDVTRYGSTWSVGPAVRYLDEELPADPEVEREVERVLSESAAINRKALEATVKPPLPGRALLGAKACARCHPDEHRLWVPSSHAKATEKLKVDHQEGNPECLLCHATGVGQPGGYPREDLDLSGVQCEACHGPGEGHPPGKMRAVPPSTEACGSCHTERDSPLFEPDGFWQLIRHGKAKRP